MIYQDTTYYVVDHFRDRHTEADVGKFIRAYNYSYVFDGNFEYVYVRAVSAVETGELVFVDDEYSGLQTFSTNVPGFERVARNIPLPRTVPRSRMGFFIMRQQMQDGHFLSV